jgi:RNA polymerase sigma factor (TIGR02999 family)
MERVMDERTSVTTLLHDAGRGERAAFDRLLPMVYDSLRRLASSALRRERAGHTLSATALANEAYMRLAALRHVAWQDRAHFFAVAARAMRRVLVNHAVARRAQKRGAGAAQVDIDSVPLVTDDRLEDVLAVHEALERLQRLAPDAARVVECRVFMGLTIEETAAAMDLSTATVKRHWTTARAWLTRELLARGTPRE